MAQNERRITKVKTNGVHTIIEYERERDDDHENDVVTIDSTDTPKASFKNALKALVADVVEVLEENLSVQEGKFTIRGVTFVWKKGNMGAIITAMKESSRRKSPILINTPIAFVSPFGEGEGEQHCLGAETVARLQKLQKEAWKFVDGIREDLLFSSDDETTDIPEPAEPALSDDDGGAPKKKRGRKKADDDFDAEDAAVPEDEPVAA